ncbi:hypothetical protein P6U16_00555 [Rhizobium sp. 32-5/1]|uniref:hypothetical protein n=1 Tax=Rhizobium sp. 32-5/1 TaxID=3019602 RepID=UPI00240D71B7|nr:hypothetical protein [Rhizobium sp. 32-5/1]WEZ83421.1 hypothetical protein P6U16_00555 [Rhizobium sp. 32-5/1]
MNKTVMESEQQPLELKNILSTQSRKRRRAVMSNLDVHGPYTNKELQLLLMFASDGDGDIFEKYDRLCWHVNAYHKVKGLKKRRLRIPSRQYFYKLDRTVGLPISPD